MRNLDQSNSQCFVFTFKEGLLSRVAHDLKIAVTRFGIEIDEAAPRVEARFDARSLRVVGAVSGSRLAPEKLSEKDKAEIEARIAGDVLDASRFPEIQFVSESVTQRSVRGRLSLCGREREITIALDEEPDEWRARCTLHQPDFGIRPYTAMLGALRIKPDVIIELAVPR